MADASSNCSKFLENLYSQSRNPKEQHLIEKEKRPSAADLLERIEGYGKEKLYHELTECLLEYVLTGPYVFEKYERIEFFRFAIEPFVSHMKPLRVSEILKIVTEDVEPEDALVFLKKFSELVKADQDGLFYFNIINLSLMVKCSRADECEDLADSLKDVVVSDVTLSVQVFYYKTIAQYHKSRGSMELFYSNSLLFLSLLSQEEISKDELEDIIYEIVMVVLLNESEFNFGELREIRIYKQMPQPRKYQWLYDLLESVDYGNWEMFEKVIKEHESEISNSSLKNSMDILVLKMKLMALTELAFAKPQKELNLFFSEIAECCRVNIKEVETVVMKAMNYGLLKGSIDEVDQVFDVRSIKPRVLDSHRINLTIAKMRGWLTNARTFACDLKKMTSELVVL